MGMRFRLITFSILLGAVAADASSVWRVTENNGNVIYLGGSVHGLSSTDYPLPSAYNRAFDASSRLVFEDEPNVSASAMRNLYKSGFYPKNDSLKNHIDPRTYDYLRRFFGLLRMPEAQLQRYRPWMLVAMLWSSATNQLGVEGFLFRRAKANGKSVGGLESFREHYGIISGLTDKQAELALLSTFVSATSHKDANLAAWRGGDVDAIARDESTLFSDLSWLHQRLIEDRNHNWIPKIEKLLHSGQIYFVVVGAGHMGGPQGLLALLKSRGYRVEQI